MRLHLWTFAALVLFLPLWGVSAHADGLLGDDLSTFAVLGSSTVTNVPTSTISGSVGVWSAGGANAITGFNSSPGVAVSDSQVTSGTVQAGTASAQAAQSELTTAITNLGGLASTATSLTGENLGGLSLSPGIYSFATLAQLTGTLNLVNPGDIPDATWVFLIGSTLTTASSSVVNVYDPSGSGEGVYWDVGSSATLGTDTSFEGNILATASITADTGATDDCGRLLASTGQVSLDDNTISTACTSTDTEGGTEGSGTNGFSGATAVATPEPGTLTLLLVGLAGLLAFGKVSVSSLADPA